MTRSPYDRLRELASDWEAQVRHRRADLIAARAMLQAAPNRSRFRRPLAAATTLAAVAVVVVGLGAVADGAVPGQVLYPVDRAYESVGEFVGVTTDRGEERLVEALELMERGRGADAAVLVDEALAHFERDPDLAQVGAAVAEVVARPPTTTTTTPPPAEPLQPVAEPQADPPDPVEAPTSTTTSPPVTTPAPPAAPPATAPAVPPDQPVLTAAEAPDPVTSLRVATEYLLQTVRDAKRAVQEGTDGVAVEEVREATEEVLLASAAVKEETTEPEELVAQDPTTTSTSTTTSSTSTTTTSTTSTTTTTTTSTTTTTLVDGEEDTGPGPIILPPIP